MNRKRMRRIGFVLLAGMLLAAVPAGCSGQKEIWLSKSQETGEKPLLTGMKEIEEAFRAQGYAIAYEQEEEGWLSGEKYRMVLNEDLDCQIVFYVYETVEEAKKETGYIDPAGSMITVPNGRTKGEVIVEWISVPHFYQYQNMIIQYIGLDERVLGILEEICGAYFAGGELS